MRRFLLASLIGMLIANLAFGVDIKSQIGTQDLNVDTDGAAHGTFQRRTSTGGTITLDKIDGNQIPWSNAYTRTIRPADFITRGPWVDVRARGAVCDNSTNDAAAIQAALDNMTSGTLVIPGMCAVGSASWEGLHMTNKSSISIIGLNDNCGLRLLAQPTQVILAGTWHPVLLVTSSSHIKIHGLTINRNGIVSAGIGFNSVSDSEISHNHIYGAPTDASTNNTNIATGGYCYRNTYAYNLIEGGTHGILLGSNLANYETDSSITHNVIRNLDGDGAVIMGARGDISFNHFDNVNAGVIFSSLSTADYTNNIGKFHVANGNIINKAIWAGMQMDANAGSFLEHVTISNNVISRSGKHGIMAYFCRNCSVVGNTIYGVGWDNVTAGVGILSGLGAKNVAISNNVMDGGEPYTTSDVGINVGIGTQGSDNNFIIDGNIIKNFGSIGVQLNSEEGYISSHYKITNNIISNAGLDGVQIESTDFKDIYFSGNTSMNNGRYGLYNAHPVSRQLYGSNNVYDNNAAGNISGGNTIMITPYNTAHAYLASAPTDNTVTWNANDVVWKIGADNVIGWKCTVGGSPGTWKSMTITLEP